MLISSKTKSRTLPLIIAAVVAMLAASAAFAQSPSTNSAAVKIKLVPITWVSPSDGPKMYAQYCASCHGALGKGDGPAASAFATPPTDLTSLTAINNGKFPESQVRHALDKFADSGADVVQKSGNATMPYWHDAFRNGGPVESAMRVHNLVLQVKALQVADTSTRASSKQ